VISAEDPHGRALWHLELLGCYAPEDAFLPSQEADEQQRDEWDDNYEDDEYSCTHCGGEGFLEVDDVLWDDCDEYGWGPCNSCRGTGLRSHQWVF